MTRTLAEMIAALEECQAAGMTPTQICREAGVEADFYIRWSAGKTQAEQFAGHQFSQAQESE